MKNLAAGLLGFALATTIGMVSAHTEVRKYNARLLSSEEPMIGCSTPRILEKALNLMAAKRPDLVERLDCITLPAPASVIHIDTMGSLKEVVWEHEGEPITLWVLGAYFLNERDRTVLRKCGPGMTECSTSTKMEFVESP
ncbi:hypothetical protein [Mesorhizobium sp. IMUNJ 23232]|uniref:hypothetical protein n=1 Tax=Mesorhizobium sp. IMUNJ 23232 TaxID=3376064 RepID=UPI0037BBFE0A